MCIPINNKYIDSCVFWPHLITVTKKMQSNRKGDLVAEKIFSCFCKLNESHDRRLETIAWLIHNGEQVKSLCFCGHLRASTKPLRNFSCFIKQTTSILNPSINVRHSTNTPILKNAIAKVADIAEELNWSSTQTSWKIGEDNWQRCNALKLFYCGTYFELTQKRERFFIKIWS